MTLDSVPVEQVAFLYAYDIAPGRKADFEAGYKAHLKWHADHKDALTWYGWYAISGPRVGAFIDGAFGASFSGIDNRPKPRDDGVDFNLRVAPFAQAKLYDAYVRWGSVSTSATLENSNPTPVIDVYRVKVAPRDARAFERTLESLASESKPSDFHWAWYRAVAGADLPSYMVIAPRERWADLTGPMSDLSRLAERAYGVNAARADALSELVVSVTAESWGYRPELSYFPPAD